MTTKLISTVTRSAVSTAAHVARHPVGTATQAVTLVKGVAELGLDLVHGSRSRSPWTEADRPRPQTSETAEKSADQGVGKAAAKAGEKVAQAAGTVAEAAPRAGKVVAQAAHEVEAEAAEVASDKPAASPAAHKVAAGAEKVADVAEKAATKVEEKAEKAQDEATEAAAKASDEAVRTERTATKSAKSATSRDEARAGKPAHEPAAGTAPTGEPVDTEAVRKDPEQESTPAAHDAEETDDPRDHIPGPDLATFAPPAPEDLPEPIVIEAE